MKRLLQTGQDGLPSRGRAQGQNVPSAGARQGAFSTIRAVQRTSGRPLDAETLGFMESRFGRGFAGIRIHTDERADEASVAVGARAFTVGRHIAFAAGQYSPSNDEGRRLIVHELVHTLHQEHDSPWRIRREAQPDLSADRRDFVETAIRFLNTVALNYRNSSVNEAGLQRTLDGLKATVENSQQIITQFLGGDPALEAQLRGAYQGAVSELVRSASRQLNRTANSIYQSERDRIHEWAWIQPSADPAAHAASAALLETERQRITVITRAVTIGDLHDLFSTETATTNVPLPQDVTASFAGSIPSELQPGLSNVAGRLTQGNILVLNSTITVALDLEAFGGAYGAYRFTYVRHTPPQAPQTSEILIEHLGSIGIEGLTEPQREAQVQRFQQHGFSRGTGWSNEEYEALLQAIAQVPDGMLTPVDGLTFDRATEDPTDPDAGGAYDPDTHTITMYDRGFGSSMTRFGTPGAGGVSTDAVRNVIHEIGHAIDLLPLRQAWTSYEQAQDARHAAFAQFEDSPGSHTYTFPDTMQGQFDTFTQQITQAEQALTQARAASGERYQLQSGTWEMVEGGTGAGSSAFRQAALQDGGTRITSYSTRNWREYFAESFSLYMTNPAVLEQLRPNVYAYFVGNHPR